MARGADMNAFKEQCIALRREGYTLSQIVHATGRPKTSVYFHIRHNSLPAEKIAAIRTASGQRIREYALARKGKSTRAFTELTEWTPEAVLLIGHLIFDGEILHGSCAYNNRSLALLARVETLMKDVYAYEPSRYTNEGTGVMRLGYFNVALANHLQERAHVLLSEIRRLSRDMQREFLRSFFDDEGCMDFAPPKRRRVRGYQKDACILQTIQELLAGFGIESNIVSLNEVAIAKKENLLRFEQEINFSPGVYINGDRTNSRWKKHIEKRQLLRMAIESYKT